MLITERSWIQCVLEWPQAMLSTFLVYCMLGPTISVHFLPLIGVEMSSRLSDVEWRFCASDCDASCTAVPLIYWCGQWMAIYYAVVLLPHSTPVSCYFCKALLV